MAWSRGNRAGERAEPAIETNALLGELVAALRQPRGLRTSLASTTDFVDYHYKPKVATLHTHIS